MTDPDAVPPAVPAVPDRPPDPLRLRASDADRERVAQVLRQAVGEGRLSIGEVDDRLRQVYAARTVGELVPVTADLPNHAVLGDLPTFAALPQPPTDPRIGGAPAAGFEVAVFSGGSRKGEWVVPAQFRAVSIMGGIELDLTSARFAAPECTITAVAIMGGVEITVPEDITVLVHGIGIMGGFSNNVRRQGPPGSPVLRINGFALMGGVDVRTRFGRRPLDR